MGREVKCHAVLRASRSARESGEGKALLETSEIIFRGPFRVVIPFKEISSLEVDGEDLAVGFGKQSVTLSLGQREAEKWIKAIREPKSVLDKLGIKAGQRVAVVGFDEPGFAAELRKKGAEAVDDGPVDHLFFAPQSVPELSRVKKLMTMLVPAGALWLLRPKGHPTLTEAQTRSAGKAAGLVDVKVVAFSASLSAEKYVIPLASRPA